MDSQRLREEKSQMRFQTINGLHLFQFEEVTIKQLEVGADSLTVVMDALIVKGNNPNNEEFADRYADTANMRFVNARITEIVKEGYKYYDAADRLVEEKPDRPLAAEEYDGLFRQCRDVWLYDIIAVSEQEGAYEYQIGIDLNEDDTYWLTVQCTETIVEWEKFKNRVMK